MILEKSKHSFTDLLIGLIFVAFTCTQFLYVKEGAISLQAVGMLLGIISLFFSLRIGGYRFLIFLCIIAIFSSLVTISSGRLKIGDVIFSFAMPSLAVVLNRNTRLVKPAAYIFFLIASTYCGYAIFSGADLNTELFDSSSRNYISVLAIFSSYLLYISNVKKIALFLCNATLFAIVVLSASRSGTIAFLLIILGYTLNYIWEKKSKVFLPLVLTISFSLVCAFIFSAEIEGFFDELGVVQRVAAAGLHDDGRADVIECYYDNLSPLQLILGIDAGGGVGCSFLANGTDNPHNSFIRLASGLGFLAILYYIAIFCAAIKFATKAQFIILGYLLAFIMRGSTDIIFFFQTWDIYFYSILFIAFPFLFSKKLS